MGDSLDDEGDEGDVNSKARHNYILSQVELIRHFIGNYHGDQEGENWQDGVPQQS